MVIYFDITKFPEESYMLRWAVKPVMKQPFPLEDMNKYGRGLCHETLLFWFYVVDYIESYPFPIKSKVVCNFKAYHSKVFNKQRFAPRY